MLKNHFMSAFTLVVAALLFGGCGASSDAPLLQGKINVTEPTEVSIVYDDEGETQVETVTTDSTGVFRFNAELPGGSADVLVYVGNDFYGAFVEKGASTRMNIDGSNVTFGGDNTDRSHFNNVYQSSFSPWLFKPTQDHPFDRDEWCATLDSSYRATMQALEAVKDGEARARYRLLADARRKYYMLQINSLDEMVNDVDHRAASDSLLATIDPNADETRWSGLISYWYHSLPREGGRVELVPYFAGQMQLVDSLLTNEGNKKNLFGSICELFLMYQPSDSDLTAFRTAIAPQMAKAPGIGREIDRVVRERANRIKDGDNLPGDPVLIARDGSKTSLKEVIRGRVAYIDVWATWCVPCCREIPHLEKVYERFKTDDRIVIVSLSEDKDAKAWEKKIDKDRPEWPNYLLDQRTGREFLDAMSIHSIPRFLLVGSDGRLIAVDAARPSDERIDEILREAIAKNNH